MIFFLLLASVLLGALLGEVLTKNNTWKKAFLTFSGAYLLGIVILEIFPHYFEHGHNAHHLGLFVIFGVLLQILLEGLSKGAEHGHFHSEDKNHFPVTVFVGLFIHAFIEGIPAQESIGKGFIAGILVHKVPVAAILYTFLKPLKIQKRILYLSIFAFAAPAGHLLGQYLPQGILQVSLGMTAGIFLHISSVIIFESADHHKMKLYKFISLLAGIALACASVELLQH